MPLSFFNGWFAVIAALGLWATEVRGAGTNALEFISSEVQLGIITNSLEVPVSFELTNRSDRAIKITYTGTSCPCTSVVKSPEEIAAHSHAAVELKFNPTHGKGFVTQSVQVETADGQILEAQFSGTVALMADGTQ